MISRQSILAFIILTLIVSCSVFQKSKNATEREPAMLRGVPPDGGFPMLNWIAPNPDLGDPKLSDILKIVKLDSTRSIYTFLANLSRQFPNYLSMYTLMYHSRSLQSASFKSPRAIVFGATAQTIIAFNGDKVLPGDKLAESHANVEVMSFDPTTGYQFLELQFLGRVPCLVEIG